MSEPKRIQLSRQAGWRKPEGAIAVARPTRWGNPYRWQDKKTWSGPYMPDGEIDDDPVRFSDKTRRGWAVTDFRSAIEFNIGRPTDYPTNDEIRAELGGRDLACWCPLDQPCHADVLLRIANAPAGHPPVSGQTGDQQ